MRIGVAGMSQISGAAIIPRAVIPAATPQSAGIHLRTSALYDGSRSGAASPLVRDDAVEIAASVKS
ncbi:hypothetical protein DWF00_13250 [Bosea caraganae]|uniref:Uncharacterized protein n=1 Tax=Bosea caraganae TaxID=2763117 RepID=A0A370L1E5_9HYPH|nr:hypothetical protein DWE98_21415 [Bosea caraganae]RDJ26421.1 hypothetical protein DWF00_13250 [Bosea caraganae]